MLFALTSCNEELVYDSFVDTDPVVESIYPTSGTIDTEITISGEGLNNTSTVTIGGYEVEIMNKISDTQLIVYASAEGRSGKVVVYDNYQVSCESPETFTYNYVAPVIDDAATETSGEMSTTFYLCGTYMNVVESVYFTVADGMGANGSSPDPSEAEIVLQNGQDLVVNIPYVAADSATIELHYFDGSSIVKGASSDLIEIVRNAPEVTTDSEFIAEQKNSGESITVNGINLTKVERVSFSGLDGTEYNSTINTQTDNELSFTVPVADYPDGTTPWISIKMHYFYDQEYAILTDEFSVYVPFVYFWENVKIGANDKTVYTGNCFDLDRGYVHENSAYATDLDPIACQYYNTSNTSTWDGTVCSAASTPNVTEEEYNSVNPYLFIYGSASVGVAFYNPSNSVSILRNYYIDSGSTRIYGVTTSASFCGTPVVHYRYLDPAEGTAVSTLIDNVKNGNIADINSTTVPIDPDNLTIGGVNLDSSSGGTALSGTCKYSDGWASTLTPSLGDVVYPDAVVMIVYYDYLGRGDANPGQCYHIRKVGFMHIKEFGYLAAASSSTTPSGSYIICDVTWQKYANDTSGDPVDVVE